MIIFSPSAKERVRVVDPNKGRCLIENTPEHCAVDFCHCYPRDLTKDQNLLSNIEWHWNIPYHSLNLDTRRNIFRVGASLHDLYKKDFWLLLPEDSIINQYHGSLTQQQGDWIAHRESFPTIPNRNDFEYQFIPLSREMRQMALHRQDTIPPRGVYLEIKTDHFSIHLYPFETLPKLKSHIHPKFAILEAGRKLDALGAARLLELIDRHPILVNIVQICDAWTRQRPYAVMDDPTYNLQSNSDNSDNEDTWSDQNTEPGRYGVERPPHEGRNNSPAPTSEYHSAEY